MHKRPPGVRGDGAAGEDDGGAVDDEAYGRNCAGAGRGTDGGSDGLWWHGKLNRWRK